MKEAIEGIKKKVTVGEPDKVGSVERAKPGKAVGCVGFQGWPYR